MAKRSKRSDDAKPLAVFGPPRKDHRSESGRFIFVEKRGDFITIHPARTEEEALSLRRSVIRDRRAAGFATRTRKAPVA